MMKHLSYSFRVLSCISAAAILTFSLWMLSGPAAPDTAQTAGSMPEYYAAIAQNHVVIYISGRPEPVLVTEIDARTLPDADRALLEDGIFLESAADVNRLLEDYSG